MESATNERCQPVYIPYSLLLLCFRFAATVPRHQDVQMSMQMFIRVCQEVGLEAMSNPHEPHQRLLDKLVFHHSCSSCGIGRERGLSRLIDQCLQQC